LRGLQQPEHLRQADRQLALVSHLLHRRGDLGQVVPDLRVGVEVRLQVCQRLRAGLLLQRTGHHLIGVRVRVQVVAGRGDDLAHSPGDLTGHAGVFGRGRRGCRRGGQQRGRDGPAQNDRHGGEDARARQAATQGGAGDVHEFSSQLARFPICLDEPRHIADDASTTAWCARDAPRQQRQIEIRPFPHPDSNPLMPPPEYRSAWSQCGSQTASEQLRGDRNRQHVTLLR